jgi:signal peptidase II
MKLKYLLLAAISGVIICLDQVSKMYIHTHFQVYESVPVIANFFSLTYVRNLGAAFGLFGRSYPAFREVFFLTMPPVAIGIILLILRPMGEKDRVNIIALSLIFAGAIGNYIDRLRFRYVVDFLDFHIGSYVWPAFNVADMGIVCGVGTLLFLEFLKHQKKT